MTIKVEKRLKNKIPIAVICLALAAIIAVITLSASLGSKQPSLELYDFGKEVAQGIDVSEHNKKIDWQTVKDENEIDFAFIRVGYRGYKTGEICEDKYAVKNMKEAKKAEIPFGVYFYSQATTVEEAQQEAHFVTSIIKKYNPQLPVVIDFEYPTDEDGYHIGRLFEAGLSAQENTEIINAFCEKISKSGYTPGIYASSNAFKYNIDVDELDSSVAIWLADYNSEPDTDIKYNIWQYSKAGEVKGVESKNTDLNYWYKRR